MFLQGGNGQPSFYSENFGHSLTLAGVLECVGLRGRARVGTSPTRIGSPADFLKINMKFVDSGCRNLPVESNI